MSMRRMTWLTNAFSKKAENLQHSIALHFMHYNFCRVHPTLRVTPAMEAGLELVAMLPRWCGTMPGPGRCPECGAAASSVTEPTNRDI
jgi:hypothetical protein